MDEPIAWLLGDEPAPDAPLPMDRRPFTRLPRLHDDDLCAWIEDFVEQHRYAPTVRELMEACGYTSSSSAKVRLDRLRREGRVTWNEGEQRTLRTVAPRAA
jgi:SOS-response transcriptional repressor LexA